MSDITDEAIASLAEITGLDDKGCREYLKMTDGDVAAASEAFWAQVAETEDNEANIASPAAPEAEGATAPADYTGPRTLDGRPAPQAIPTTTSSRSTGKKPQKKTGLATLSSLGASSAGGGGHDHDDDDDDDQPRGPRDTYAGGEKSGLALQDPNKRNDPKRIVKQLMKQAQSNAQRPEGSSPDGPSGAGPSSFRGSGQTLGGEGVESRTIPDPRGPRAPAAPQREEIQERTLHTWRDGFSVDDGELHRFDDPANSDALLMIQQGRAPLHLMNVRYDEPIDIKLEPHDENWRQLPTVYRPFGGEGRRLGNPVPGDAAAVPTSTAGTSSATAAPAPSSAATPAPASVDESQPSVMVRIQMPDGTRLPARFNLTQTISDVYDFITRAQPGLGDGGWVLATTFPNKDHTDKSLALGDMAEFKRGGTAVVKRT